jgi:hypothetical protein
MLISKHLQAARHLPERQAAPGLTRQPPSPQSLRVLGSFGRAPMLETHCSSGGCSEATSEMPSGDAISSSRDAISSTGSITLEAEQPAVQHSYSFTVSVPKLSARLCSDGAKRVMASRSQRLQEHLFCFEAAVSNVLVSAATAAKSQQGGRQLCFTTTGLIVSDDTALHLQPKGTVRGTQNASSAVTMGKRRVLLQTLPSSINKNLLQLSEATRRYRSQHGKEVRHRALLAWYQAYKVRCPYCNLMNKLQPAPACWLSNDASDACQLRKLRVLASVLSRQNSAMCDSTCLAERSITVADRVPGSKQGRSTAADNTAHGLACLRPAQPRSHDQRNRCICSCAPVWHARSAGLICLSARCACHACFRQHPEELQMANSQHTEGGGSCGKASLARWHQLCRHSTPCDERDAGLRAAGVVIWRPQQCVLWREGF